jgi:hypothetical protein
MTKKQLITKWVDDMIAGGFMYGWFGDKSQEFKNRQINYMMKVLAGKEDMGGRYRLLATIHSDYGNLKQYCGWKDAELKQLLRLFGFDNIRQVAFLMSYSSKSLKNFMTINRLKRGVRIPKLEKYFKNATE